MTKVIPATKKINFARVVEDKTPFIRLTNLPIQACLASLFWTFLFYSSLMFKEHVRETQLLLPK